jgi:hypothetical protein
LFTNGVNLNVIYSEPAGGGGGTLEAGDSIKVFYSLNGGPKTLFSVNGQQSNDFNATISAAQNGLIGNTIQIFVRIRFDANSPNNETYRIDEINVANNTFVPNSSPTFSQLPPLIFCAQNPFSFNQSAIDLDGDVLVYSMYTPYSDTPPAAIVSNSAVITPVTWVAGFSANSPFNSGGPAVTYNSSTGLFTGVANTLGQFVYGIKCSEFRNGVLLSETTREFQANTVTCPPALPTSPTPIANATSICIGQTLSLTAIPTSTAAATYSWTGPNSFTTTTQNPTIAVTSTLAAGVYSVY